MSIYKFTTEMGSYTIAEAASMLIAKWIKEAMQTDGQDDLAAMDSRETMQNFIRDAIIVELGKYMQASGVDQDGQNYIFKELFHDNIQPPEGS
jgi:hypothetical protein